MYKNKKIVADYAFFCSETIFPPKKLTEIIENRFDFSVRANSCSKFVSNRP